MNPNIIAKVLKILREEDVIEFPIKKLTPTEKGDPTDRLCLQYVHWGNKLPYKPIVKFLGRVFSYNLILMTHQNDLTLQMAYLINNIIEVMINLPTMICYMILKTAKVAHSIRSIPFPVFITKILTA